MKEEKFDNCFACGLSNPIGLKLKFDYKDDKAVCIFKLNSNFEGYPKIIHGGIVSTILDEAMAKIALTVAKKAVTAEMKTKFKQPLKSETEYLVEAKITKQKAKAIFVSSSIFLSSTNSLIACSDAVFFKV